MNIELNVVSYRLNFNQQLRKYVHKHPLLLKAARTLNFTARLGPWRETMIAVSRRYGKNERIATKSETLFPELDVGEALISIEKRGYADGFNLPSGYAEKIFDCGDLSEKRTYLNPHNQCELIENIVYDPKIVGIARLYLGKEPILWGSRIYWTYPPVLVDQTNQTARKKEFHFDAGDFKSLSLFIYLTDVDFDCGPHILIENTHGQKSLKQILKPLLAGETAEKIYGERIKILTGRRGFGFLEDLSSYHQHSVGSKPRLVLTVSYLLSRRPPVTL